MRRFTKPLSILLATLMILSIFSAVSFSAATIVEYVDKTWNTQQKKIVNTTMNIVNYKALTKDMTSLGSGMYVVDRNITYSKQLEIKGSANVGIVLCNGYTLENNKGIKVPQSATLTFYGQDGNTGTVKVYNADGAGIGAMDEKKTGHLIFKGGNIIAKGGNKDAGIGTGKNDTSGYEEITIYGGKIEATGGNMGAGIGAGRENKNRGYLKEINIYGGTVKAKGGEYGAGIGGGEDSDVNLINIYGGTITAQGGKEGAGIGSGNEENNDGTINIYGGTINAKGGQYGAGIGGGDNGNSGYINISGGDVTARGGEDAAGIGSGDECDVDKINISGGKVQARANDGAAIGSAEDGKMGTINISGGDVRAMSKRGAGIGGGYDEDTEGTITITGGEVYSTSSCGAGIGAGMQSDLDTPIYIEGGIVHAKSGVVNDENEFSRLIHIVANEVPLLNLLTKTSEGGAGIGCGARGSQKGKIYIRGGVVFSYGGGFGVNNNTYFGGAGIGAGMEQLNFTDADNVPEAMWDALFDNGRGTGGEGGPVEITGGIVLAAGYEGACAIGYGDHGDELGTLKLPDDYSVYSFEMNKIDVLHLVNTALEFSQASDLSEALAIYEDLKDKNYITHAATNKRVKACQTEGNVVLLLPCWHLNRTYDVTEQTHSLHCKNCKYEKLNEEHFYNDNICECALYNNVINQLTTITFTDPVSTRAYPTIAGTEYELPEGRDSEPDENGTVKKFTAWTNGGKTYQPGDKVTVTKDMEFDYQYENQYLVKMADNMTNGTLTVDYDMAAEGTTVTVTPQPAEGYGLSRIWYIRKDHGTGEVYQLNPVEDSDNFTLTMPATQLTLYAEFEKITYPEHKHADEMVFTACTDNSVLSDSGNYYLIEDTDLSASSLPSGKTLRICLMGHKLTITDNNYTVAQGANLSIYDETGKGVVTGKKINVNGTLNLHSGHLQGFTNGAVNVASGGSFYIYGGRITDNTSANHGAGVYVANGGSLNIRGDVTIHKNSFIDAEQNQTDENVYLETGAVINVNEKLSEDTVIGVTAADTENLPFTVTSALDGNASAHNFLSDNDAYFMEYDSVNDTVILSRPFTLSFDANGGSGEMESETIKDEQYFLPGCDFTAPEGKVFRCWSINGQNYQAGDSFVATSNQSATAYAVWGEEHSITINDTEHGSVTASAQTAVEDEVVTLNVTPDENYAAVSVTVNGTEVVPKSGVYRFNMPADDATVNTVFILPVEQTEPYIDENGEYCTGTVKHFEYNNKNYAYNEDGSVGEELSDNDLKLSYFDFALINYDAEYQINSYTGPADTTELAIPKTYNGKPVTVLGNNRTSANDSSKLFSGSSTQFDLILTENIKEIKSYTFWGLNVKEVKGNTSSLSNIGSYAFSWANNAGNNALDIKLDYKGLISVGSSIFNHMKVNALITHDTRFSSTSFSQQSIKYSFSDEHKYGETKWTWADNYSSATAKFTCTNSHCGHSGTVDATVTSEIANGKNTYTATAEFEGKTYTDTKSFDLASIIYKYNIYDENTGHKVEKSLTKTIEPGDYSIETLIELNKPLIKNQYLKYEGYTYEVNGGAINVQINDTEKKYTVTSNGYKLGEYKYMDTATLGTGEPKSFLVDGKVVFTGGFYKFYVCKNTDVTTGNPTSSMAEYALIDLNSISVTDNKVELDMLATANAGTAKFKRMGVAYALSNKSEDEIAAAVDEIETGTGATNKIAVHNSSVNWYNQSGQYQFRYAPYFSISKAKDATIYFYTYVVTDDGVQVSSAATYNMSNLLA